MSRTPNKLLLAAIALLLVGLAAAILFAQRLTGREPIENAGEALHADNSSRYILYGDKRYPIKEGLSTVLMIGTDNFAASENLLVKGANRNRELADFLVLLVIDHSEKTITPLQLNRDTICEVPWLDEKGAVGGYKTEHLTFAHSYGSGEQDSCLNTVRAVRGLLFNAPIANYLAFTMDAVPPVNDMVGGVTVTLTEDIPSLGEDYRKDATIRLRGKDALRFIRYREEMGGSNYFRMKRQRQYLYAFTDAARSAGSANPDLAMEVYEKVDPYLCTSLTVDNLTRLYDQLCDYTLCETLSPSGDIVPGDDFYELHVHESSLWDCVYQCYCVEDTPGMEP